MPAHTVPKRKYCRTEFHPDAEEYLKSLADDVGVEVGYIIRLCVGRSLPEIEAILRTGELPHDEMKRPTAPLKTRRRKVAEAPLQSKQPPPPLAILLETGEMPPEPEPLPVSPEPAPEPEPREDRQEPEPAPEPRASPVSDPDGSSPSGSEPPPPARPGLRRRRG